MPGMSNFAQVPTRLICRFHELTKTEIVVWCFLFASRNRQTGVCNPSRGAVSRATGIAKPHVSTAVKTLDDKGWIFEEPNGNFILHDDPLEVTKSVTPKVTKSVTEGLRNPSQGVTKSVTKGYEIRNSHIKDSEQRNEQRNEHKEEGAEAAPGPESFGPRKFLPPTKHDHPAIKAIRDITKRNPNKAIWDDLIDLLGDDPDIPRLVQCHKAWVTKGFKEINLAWVTEWYVEGIPGRKEKTNGNGQYGRKPSNSEVLQQWADYIEQGEVG